jgi:hypothetical protein
MATRDLTTTYLRLRSALHHRKPQKDEGPTSGGLLTQPGTVDVSSLGLGASPVYVDLVNEINSDINALQQRSKFCTFLYE